MEVSCATDKINMIISCCNIFAVSLSNHASPATYASLINNGVCGSCRILASAASLVCFIRPTDEIFRLKKGSAAYQARPYLNFIRFSSVSFSFLCTCLSAIPQGGGHSTHPSGTTLPTFTPTLYRYSTIFNVYASVLQLRSL